MSDVIEPEIYDDMVEREENSVYFYADCCERTIYKLTKFLREIKKERYTFANVIISSNGGTDVSIYEFIKNLGIPVYTFVNGICASAATMIFLAGTKRYISETAIFMIHSCQPILEGKMNKGAIQDVDGSTKIINDLMKSIYERECKIPKKELELLLTYQERFLTAKDCINWKIAHEIKTFIGA